MFDFVDFVLDVDELEVGFVFVAVGFGVLVACFLGFLGFLGLRFYGDGIHFLVFGFLGLRKWLWRFLGFNFSFFWRDFVWGGV